MGLILKQGSVKFKDQTGNYVSVNTVAERTTAEQIAAIGAEGERVLNSLPDDYTEMQTEINNKQDKLIAGTNINITGSTINAITATTTEILNYVG